MLSTQSLMAKKNVVNPQSESKLANLILDVLLLIVKELDARSTAALAQTCKLFRDLDLIKIAKKKIWEKNIPIVLMNVLDKLNHHDLLQVGLQSEELAMFIMHTPLLAVKLNQPLYSADLDTLLYGWSNLKYDLLGYCDQQYDSKNNLDKSGLSYVAIKDPIAELKKRHPKVSKLLQGDHFCKTQLTKQARNYIINELNLRKKEKEREKEREKVNSLVENLHKYAMHFKKCSPNF